MKVPISRTLSTLRRMIISGRDKAMTDIMNASTVPRAAPLPKRASTTGMMPAALEYMGTPMTTARGTDHQTPLPMIDAMNPSGTYPWMPAPTGDTDDQVNPDLAQDIPDGIDTGHDPIADGQPVAAFDRGPGGHRVDPVLDVVFKVQPADDPSGDDRDGQAGAHVQGRHFPAQKPVEQAQGDFVDQGGGDQERKGDAQGHTGGDKADKQGDGAARAKRAVTIPQNGRQDVADKFTFTGQYRAGALRSEKTANDADTEHHQHQQHQHLGGVIEKKFNRRRKVGILFDIEQ